MFKKQVHVHDIIRNQDIDTSLPHTVESEIEWLVEYQNEIVILKGGNHEYVKKAYNCT